MAGFVFILGMHRSGTSCLAGCLARCGLHLGSVRGTGRFNEKGYFENEQVVRLHDQLLALNRGFWHRPPDRVEVHDHFRRQFAAVAAELARHQPCGLKDPRLLLVLDAWREAVTAPQALVGTFRHPVAVAESLGRRNGLGRAEALALWCRYNAELVRLHRADPFPLVEFDLGDPEVYCRTVAGVAGALGLDPNPSRLRRFASANLEHHNHAETPVPESCQELHAYLRQHRSTPDPAAPAASLYDRLKDSLQEALGS